MRSSISVRAVALGAACAGALAAAAPAAAATNPLGCRASVGYAVGALPGSQKYEPLVANDATTPCKTDSATARNGVSFGGVNVGPTGAFTGANNPDDSQPSAAALASGTDSSLNTQFGTVKVQAVQAQASLQCSNGMLLPTSAYSKVLGVQVNGQEVVPPAGTSMPGRYYFPGSNNQSYIQFNETDVTDGSLTQTAVIVHLQGAGDVVLGQATVTGHEGDCPRPFTIPGGGVSGLGNVTPCPTGTSFDPLKLACVTPATTVPGSGSGSGSGTGGGSGSGTGGGSGLVITVGPITVSRPYQGPTGGTVVPLAVASRVYPGNPCVKGQGPAFVIVGTNGNDRIDGTRAADRIIALEGSDRIAGQGGNDCISDGNGTDTVFAGNGNARITVGNGNDRIWTKNGDTQIKAGNGNDRVYTGNGNVRINVGNGADIVSTGNGNSTVTVGTHARKVAVGNGRSHITAHARAVRVYCGSRRDHAYVPRSAAAFARRHGCTVTPIKK